MIGRCAVRSRSTRAVVLSLASRTYHELSHAAAPADEVVVHRWYNEQLAAYLKTLRDTPDMDGRTLLDNALVVNWTEMRLGSHSFDNIPIQAGGRLAGWRRLVRYPGYATNDLWRTVANVFGDAREIFGDAAKNTGRLAGLFAGAPLDGFTGEPSKASRSRSLAPLGRQ